LKTKSSKQKAESLEHPKGNFGLSTFSFPLRIGYDGKRAANNFTGLGNYSRSLIGHLAKQFPKNLYFIYTPKAREAILKLPLFAKENIILRQADQGKLKLFWRSLGIKKLLLKDKIDLFHGLSHEIPFGIKKSGIKSIVTIHDLIFLRKPQYYKQIDRLIYKFKSKYACKKADRIIAISEQTKNDIIALYKTDSAKIEVIYQSCDDSFKTLLSLTEKEKIRLKYQLPEKYLLNVGTIEPRKNLLQLIKSLPKVNVSYPLVVIGKETGYAVLVKKEIEKLGLQKRVIFLKDIPFSDLPAIYQSAKVFILPSFYEGFGIPIIEALYGNVPVIAATGSCLEEAGGPNSIYVSPNNVDDLADSINLVLNDKELQQNMKEKGMEYVQKFNSEIINQQLINCYLKTLNS
jgi:glycosyltransferase involved in cell wall biosynthesis